MNQVLEIHIIINITNSNSLAAFCLPKIHH